MKIYIVTQTRKEEEKHHYLREIGWCFSPWIILSKHRPVSFHCNCEVKAPYSLRSNKVSGLKGNQPSKPSSPFSWKVFPAVKNLNRCQIAPVWLFSCFGWAIVCRKKLFLVQRVVLGSRTVYMKYKQWIFCQNKIWKSINALFSVTGSISASFSVSDWMTHLEMSHKDTLLFKFFFFVTKALNFEAEVW